MRYTGRAAGSTAAPGVLDQGEAVGHAVRANYLYAGMTDAAAMTRYLQTKDIYIRNKTGDYGCDGCIRVTTGVVEHTERCLSAMEDYLCGER